jgi:UDP-2,3-diacylglucosamine hydrolase
VSGFTLFISDLHLCAERPAANARFLRFLSEVANQADALYILGDFFEAWVGDDDLVEPLHAQVAGALRRLAEADVDIHVMHGNRDFLLAEGFCRASGARLLSEPTLLDLYGTPTLLLHGDSLCTDDADYQRFRAQVRDPAWQADFLAKPLDERRAIARKLRELSDRSKSGKAMASMDVNPEAVAEQLRASGAARMIHGHTHQPARHELAVDGRPCERWVLPDWYDTGGYLTCDASSCRLVDLPA